MDFIGLIVIFFIIVSSILQKMQEQKAMRKSQEAKKAKTKPEDLPEETRRMLYGPSGEPTRSERRSGEPEVREARPKSRRPAQQQSDPAKELMEALFGAEEDDSEGDWVPVPPTQRRDVTSRQARRQPTHERKPHTIQEANRQQREASERQATQGQRRTVQREQPPARQAQRRPQESQEQRRQRVLAEREHRKQQRAASQRQQTQRRAATRRLAPRPAAQSVLFTDLHDVRRAIVLHEILGEPRGLQKEIHAWK